MSTISIAISRASFLLGIPLPSSTVGLKAKDMEVRLLKMEAKEMLDGSFWSTRTTQFGLRHSKDHSLKKDQNP